MMVGRKERRGLSALGFRPDATAVRPSYGFTSRVWPESILLQPSQMAVPAWILWKGGRLRKTAVTISYEAPRQHFRSSLLASSAS